MGGGWRRPQRGGHGPPRPGADAGTGDTGPARNAHPRPGGGLDAPTDGRDAQPAGRRQPGSGNGHGAAAPSQANERPAPRRGRPAADGSRAADCNAARIPLSRVGASASSGMPTEGGPRRFPAGPHAGGTSCKHEKRPQHLTALRPSPLEFHRREHGAGYRDQGHHSILRPACQDIVFTLRRICYI